MKEEYERKLIDLEERADTIRVILILLWGAYLILTHICMVTICLTKNKDEIVDVNSFIALAKDQGNYLEVRLGENNGRARLGLLHLDCYRALLGLISAPERMDLLLYPTKPCNTILSQILNVDTKELVSAAPLPPPPPVEPETVNFLAERKVKKPEKKQGRKQRKKKRSRANQEDITESEVDEQEVDRRLDGIKEELKGLPSFIQLVDNKDVKGLEALLKYIQSGMRIIKNGGKTCTNCGADMYVFHGHKPGFVKWMCSKYRKKLGCPSYLKRVGPNHWTMDLPQQKKQKKNKNRDPDHVPDQVSKSKSASKSEAQ
ncbi:hypothetical protein AAMO2058_001184500 [Amorphochlora amoebiformis]